MRRQQQLILAAVVTVFATQPAWAEESPILRRNEMGQPATTLEEWQKAIAQAVVQITQVQLNPTDAGFEVILETNNQLATPVTRVVDNALIADIPNAVLTLPNGEFQAVDPTEGIASVSVTNLPGENVRVTISGVDAPPTAQVSAVAQGLVLSVAPPVAESGDETIEIVVTGEQDGYFIPETTTGTRTNTPTRDIPFSIQIVPQQVLREQQIQRISEALRNVAGVQSEQSPRSAFDAPRIRGFGGFDSFNIVTNGLQGNAAFAQIGIGNIERVEVLKGPAAALFSQGGPGGTVNIVTKQPLSTPFYNVEASVGSFDTYSGLIDLSGPLDAANNVLYRFNAYGYRTDTFVDFFEIERYGFAPVVSLRLDDNTDLTLEGEYTYFEQPNDRGLPARGTVLPNPNGELPISRFLGEPSIDYVSRRATRLGFNLEHRLDENWLLRNNFRVSLFRQPQNSVFPDTLLEDNRTLTRRLIVAEQQQINSYLLNADVTGNFNTGDISHQLLIGFDLYTLNNTSRNIVERSLSPIDIFNPVYSPNNVGDVIAEFPPSSTNTDQYGIYIQDQITLLDNLKLLLGGRFDWVEQRTKEEGELTGSQSDDAFSPRVGIVYQPIQPISLYASYSRSFKQVTGSGLDNRLFEPERGTQYEVGTKVELSDRLAATLAYFNITRANILTADPVNLDFSIQVGEQQSQGIDFDITGEILPGWNIIAGYAYTNAEITEDNTYEVGNQINNVPNHAFNIWTTYELQTGSLQGLGFGLGLFYVGEREGDLDNSFSLPSYVRTDAAIFYNRGQFRVALNVRNLFDIRYFETAEGDLRVFPGEPLTLLGSVSWQF